MKIDVSDDDLYDMSLKISLASLGNAAHAF